MSAGEDGKGEAFLERWSRRKRQPQAAAPEEKPVAAAEAKPAVPLPPVDELKPDSDFTPFMQAEVDPATRRSALKKLFAGDAHFNLPDPYEAYCEDYTKSDPIPEAMLRTLNQAQRILFNEEKKPAEAATAAAAPAAAPAAEHKEEDAERKDA